MTADTLGVDEVVRHIEVVPHDRDERVVCFLVRSMGTTVHHLQGIGLADVVAHFRRVVAHDQQLITVTDFLQMRLHTILPKYLIQILGNIPCGIILFSDCRHNENFFGVKR